MEKVSFVENGILRLPPGFRFRPTDEELVVQYLKRKVFSFPLPASIIPELEVYKSDPWDLPGDMEQEKYFFSTKEVKYPNGNRSNRATKSGYWKATGIDKQISIRGQQQQLVGFKKTLVFYGGKSPHGCRTNWIMHEFRLANIESNNYPPQGNWVICRIFTKRRACTKNEDKNIENAGEITASCISEKKKKKNEIVYYDFMGRNNMNGVEASSTSSGITDLNTTTNEESDESCCNSFSTSFRRKR